MRSCLRRTGSSWPSRLAAKKLHLGVFQGYEFAWAQEKYPELKPLAVAVNVYTLPHRLRGDAAGRPATDFAGLKGQSLAIPATAAASCGCSWNGRARPTGKKPANSSPRSPLRDNVEDALDDVVDGTVQAVVGRSGRPGGVQAPQAGPLQPAERGRPVVSPSRRRWWPTTTRVLDEATLRRFKDGLLGAAKKEKGQTLLTLFHLTGFEAVPGRASRRRCCADDAEGLSPAAGRRQEVRTGASLAPDRRGDRRSYPHVDVSSDASSASSARSFAAAWPVPAGGMGLVLLRDLVVRAAVDRGRPGPGIRLPARRRRPAAVPKRSTPRRSPTIGSPATSSSSCTAPGRRRHSCSADLKFIERRLEPGLRQIAEAEGGLAGEIKPIRRAALLRRAEARARRNSDRSSRASGRPTRRAPAALLVSPDEPGPAGRRRADDRVPLEPQLADHRRRSRTWSATCASKARFRPGLDVALTGSAVIGRDHTRAELQSVRATGLLTVLLVIVPAGPHLPGAAAGPDSPGHGLPRGAGALHVLAILAEAGLPDALPGHSRSTSPSSPTVPASITACS